MSVDKNNDGVLSAFVGEDKPALTKLKDEIDRHRKKRHAEDRKARQSMGVEIGAGVAKFFVKQWTPKTATAWTGKTIVDAKMRLIKRNGVGTDEAYRDQIARILDTFGIADHGTNGDWLIPPRHFDFDQPKSLLKDCPAGADIVYVYGTQGPREAARIQPLHPDEMRILSGDEEGLVVFEAIVPNDAQVPGAMAIEVGAGSTELALVGRDGHRHAITFAIGGRQPAGLGDIARAIGEGNVPAARYLESEQRPAKRFIDEAHGFVTGARNEGKLFLNPNTDSAEMRTRAGNAAGTIGVDAILRYADENDAASFAGKARILGTLARALAFTTIHEGVKGGLKEGMAQFIGEALT